MTLLERDEALGGQVNLILRTPGRDEFGWITRDLEVQLRKAGVDVRLGTEATVGCRQRARARRRGRRHRRGAQPHRVLERQPARRPAPRRPTATTSSPAGTCCSGRAPVGDRVVVLDDDGSRAGGRRRRGAARRAASSVELVSRWPALFPGMMTTLDMPHVYGRVLGKGLEYRLNSWASGIEGGRVSIFNLYTGAADAIEGVDTVVLAIGAKANDELYFALKGSGREPAPDRRLHRAAQARPRDLRGRAGRARALVARGALHLRGRARALGGGERSARARSRARRRTDEVGGRRGAEAPRDLQPGVREVVVERHAGRNGDERGDVDAVQVAVGAVRVEKRRDLDATPLDDDVVDEHAPPRAARRRCPGGRSTSGRCRSRPAPRRGRPRRRRRAAVARTRPSAGIEFTSESPAV